MKDLPDVKPVAGPYPENSASPRCKAFEPFPVQSDLNHMGYNCGLREGHEGNHMCACCCGHEWASAKLTQAETLLRDDRD